MTSLYRLGQVLALLQTCYSRCSAPFDPKTLLIGNYKNSSHPGFNLLRNADIAMCMMICFKFKLCRSVDWIQEEKICQLNSRFVFQNDSSLMTKGTTFHVERENFPVHLAGNCLINICTEDYICIGGKCVLVLEDKIYKSCSDIVKRDPGKIGQDGVYVIYSDTRREVYCDMTTDGGGWTTIQKRQDGDLDFYRTWNEFKEGFGNAFKNYWLGNDVIFELTKNKDQELRVELQRFNGDKAYAQYSTFYIGNEASKYVLTVSGYSGTAGDSLDYHSGMQFSTKDQDNDKWSTVNCAEKRRGAWWYKNCTTSNLNGEYGQSGVTGKTYPVWYDWKEKEALKQTVMMIRNKN